MVLSWDFEYSNDKRQKLTTRTSQDLLEEATYPIVMHEIIDNRVKRNDPLINNLFVQVEQKKSLSVPRLAKQSQNVSEILTLKMALAL